jgi:hypothetical protein
MTAANASSSADGETAHPTGTVLGMTNIGALPSAYSA